MSSIHARIDPSYEIGCFLVFPIPFYRIADRNGETENDDPFGRAD